MSTIRINGINIDREAAQDAFNDRDDIIASGIFGDLPAKQKEYAEKLLSVDLGFEAVEGLGLSNILAENDSVEVEGADETIVPEV